jgi:putative DNA primase/helicase
MRRQREDGEFMDLNLSGIPRELKRLPNWVNWTIENRDGKDTKIPINPKTGGQAQSNNSSTWATYDQALKCYKKCENERIQGIGFVPTNGYVGVDLDHCRDPEAGHIESWAQEIISQLNSYTEITPSGAGVRVWIKGTLPSQGRKKGNIEMYTTGRFFTVTGQHLEGTPIEIHHRENELRAIHSKVFGNGKKPKSGNSLSLSDVDLIKKAMAAANGDKFNQLWTGDFNNYPSQSEADLALCLLLAFWTGKDPGRIDSLFRQSGLMREKWDEKHFGDGRTYGEATIQTAIEQTTEVYSGPKTNHQDAPSSYEDKKETYAIGINLTDLGNARRFVAAHGNALRYCFPWAKWLYWDGQRWIIDDIGEIHRRAKNTIALIYKEAAEEKDNDRRKALGSHALKCESDGKLKAIVELAKSEPGIPILPDDMDRDPWLLNVENGTVNLLTGNLQPHECTNYITKLAPVIYQVDADCPFWIEHLNKIMVGNQNLIAFLQRAYGYSLTGITDERVAFIQHGIGANGKTTSNEVISVVQGDYAIRTPTETLLIKREGAIPNDVAKLKGARFVFCSEAEEGKRLGESLLKDLTGGDTISARFMRGEWFEFQPTFKIWLATNHKPIIRGTDNAIWDRIRLVPFTVSIPESERIPRRDMMIKFAEELPGILAWMVRGCLEWQKYGLGTPEEVRQATKGYKEEMDVVGDFIDECCVVSKTETATVKELYKSYAEWCEANGERAIKKREFGERLSERGFAGDRTTGGTRQRVGIGLRK